MTSCSVVGCDRPHYGRGFCYSHWRRWTRYGDPLAGRTSPGSLMAFIDRAVAYVGADCLVWPYRTTQGYGLVEFGGIAKYAHRLVLERTSGPPPAAGMQAAHAPLICHNRACVNPAHLRWATPTENHADRVADGTHLRGETSPSSKLTESDVLAIRDDGRPHRVVAATYGVSESNIRMIRARKSWAWLDGAPTQRLESA